MALLDYSDGNGPLFDRKRKRKWIIGGSIGLAALIVIIIVIISFTSSNVQMDELFKGSHVLNNVPLIDGHNDLPFNLRTKLKNNLNTTDFTKDLRNDSLWGTKVCNTCHTDISRLRDGKLGGQIRGEYYISRYSSHTQNATTMFAYEKDGILNFWTSDGMIYRVPKMLGLFKSMFWVAYVPCESQFKDAVQLTFEQIDVIKRFISKYSKDLKYVDSSRGIKQAFNDGKIASLIAVEGGHSMDSRLGLLRQYYELGVRYMTLTHTCNTPWGDASPVDDPTTNLTALNNGLSDWGKKVVLEMNRIGMMVDLSHVSHQVQLDALNVSKAPIIFSHSSSYAVFNHHRNVHDDVLQLIPKNGGIVMVNFFPDFVHNVTESPANISHIADHINYIFDITGPDHVGIGSDYDGVPSTPIGLEDTSKFPDLFDFLAEKYPQKWTRENLEKLASNNILRVFSQVEEVKVKLQNELPEEEWIPEKDLWKVPNENLIQCRTELKKPIK